MRFNSASTLKWNDMERILRPSPSHLSGSADTGLRCLYRFRISGR